MKRVVTALALGALILAGCGRPSSVSEEIERQDKEAAAAAAATLAAGETYLAANKARPGVKVTASGLQYEVVRAGDPKLAPPGPSDTVTVMYEGKLTTGKVFDSSYARGEPIQFEVGGVIAGWTEALQLMRPGSEFRLVIPPDIGYGAEAKGDDIPANSVLIFRVELLGYRTPDGHAVGKP